MKKRIIVVAMAISAITMFGINGCKKSGAVEADQTSDFTVQSEDQTFVSSEDDAMTNDINSLLENDTTFAGRTEDIICDATITHSSGATTRIVTLTFNGQNCNGNHTRTGVMVLTLPKQKKWRDAGAQLLVTYQNLKITSISDHKSIVLNGTKTITNVSGGELYHLASLQTITHTITSNSLSVTFDNGSTRQWNIAKKRVFTFNNGVVVTITGTHTDGGVSNIAEWGTNRDGKEFTVQIQQPIVIRQDCDFRVVSGQIVYSKLIVPFTITFGLNASGNATTCPGTGHYYYKLEWTGIQNVSHNIILPY